jgi:hypothetical protein
MRRALVLGAVIVVGFAVASSAQALTGHWRIDLTIDPQSPSFVDAFGYSTELLVKYTVGNWTFSSMSKLDESGWTEQDFSAIGVIGGFTVSSALSFDPDVPEFDKWTTTTTVEIAGVTFSGTFELYDEDVFLTLLGRGTSGGVDIDVTVRLGDDDDPIGDCDLDFSSLQIGVDFPFCCAEVQSTVYFDCDGFERIVFQTSGIAISNLPWVTFDATLQFTVQSKSLAISPNFDFSAVCVELYVGVETSGNLTFEALHFDGFKLVCDVGNVEFTAISFWGDFVSKPGILGDYWEMYKIEADEDACCGPFDFEAAVFFDENSVHLFDVGKFTFDMSIEFTPSMEFSMGTDYVLGIGVTSLDFGFLVTW